jgi:hypothetical protein
MIVTVLSDITGSLSTLPAPTFYHAEQYEQNVNDEASLPLIYLEHPVKATDTILPQGGQEPTYTVNLFFLDKSNLSDDISTRQVIVDAMYAIKREFIIRLNQDSRVKAIKSVSYLEVYNVLDINLDGLLVTLVVTLNDGAPVCLT